MVLSFFTWSAVSSPPCGRWTAICSPVSSPNCVNQAIASSARDVILCGVLTTLAIGSTIACCLFSYGGGVNAGIKVAAYFWIISAILAWWRVTVYLMEEAYGKGPLIKYFPVFRTPQERRQPLLVPGLGEPGVKRGMPGVI